MSPPAFKSWQLSTGTRCRESKLNELGSQRVQDTARAVTVTKDTMTRLQNHLLQAFQRRYSRSIYSICKYLWDFSLTRSVPSVSKFSVATIQQIRDEQCSMLRLFVLRRLGITVWVAGVWMTGAITATSLADLSWHTSSRVHSIVMAAFACNCVSSLMRRCEHVLAWLSDVQ